MGVGWVGLRGYVDEMMRFVKRAEVMRDEFSL